MIEQGASNRSAYTFYILQAIYDAGEMSKEAYEEVKQDLKDASEGKKELEFEGKKIKVHKKHCSICKKEGHNKRTCPDR